MNKQKGFTLIELVVVMVILGILAAFAIPRFYDFRAQARIAVLTGLSGAMMSAANIAHGAQLAQNLAANAPVTMEGAAGNVAMGFRYPTAAGITAAINSSLPVAAGAYSYNGTCSVTYNPPASLNAAPSVTLVTTGCGL